PPAGGKARGIPPPPVISVAATDTAPCAGRPLHAARVHRLVGGEDDEGKVGRSVELGREDLTPQLLCDQATVYRHRNASDKRRSGRTQPHDSFCNLFRLANPPDWLHSDETRLCFRTH